VGYSRECANRFTHSIRGDIAEAAFFSMVAYYGLSDRWSDVSIVVSDQTIKLDRGNRFMPENMIQQ